LGAKKSREPVAQPTLEVTVQRIIPYFKLLLLAVLIGLTACSSPDNSVISKTTEPYYVASVNIDANTSLSELEAKYEAKAVVFKPEVGFAILGFSKEAGELTTLTTSINQDAFASPEVTASGTSAWATGTSAWATGWSAWASGWSAWASGTSIPQAPTENQAFWDQIQLNRAHAISRKFGQGVTVAVIDTGLDLNHSIFQGRLSASSSWKDYVDGDTYPMEVSGGNGYGHGTGAAGIILQLAPKATLMPIRVLDKDGKGNLDDVIAAIAWAVDKGANIINLSLGSNEYSYALQLMTDYAASNGVYIITSAGNNGLQNGLTYPATMSFWGNKHVISVASVKTDDILSSFSAYGSGLFLSAPGENVMSAYPGNKVARMTGTSFAAPIVSGALALAYSELPVGTNKDAFWDHLKHSIYGNDFGERNRVAKGIADYAFGWGRLDAEALIRTLPSWTSPIGSSELLPNGGFENGSLAGWWRSSSSGVSIVSSNASQGSKAVRLGTGEQGLVYTLSNLSANTTYTVTANLRNSVSGAGVSMGMTDFGGANIWKWAEDTAYATYSITFKTGPSSTQATVSFWRDGPGYTYVDEVSLKKW
jgi:hypothetical protein